MEDNDRVRKADRLRADDVGRLRMPGVRGRAIVALDDKAVLCVAADDPVDHLRARHRIALRHVIRNHLTLVIRGMVLDEHEVARLVARQHAVPRDEDVAGVPAHRLRAEVLEPDEAHQRHDRDARGLVRALERAAEPISHS